MRIRTTFLATLALCTAPAVAIAGPYDEAIEAIVDEAVADWSPMLSCSVLDSGTHDQLVGLWDDQLERLESLVAEADVEPELVAALAERLDPANLMAPTEGDVPTLIAFCADVDWRRIIAVFDFVRPAEEVEALLDQ